MQQHGFKNGDNKLELEGPLGAIEAVLTVPDKIHDDNTIVIVCHPHSLHGGSMTNKVVHTIAKSSVSLGFLSIRFNFRGVGKSAGEFDHGEGEGDDLAAVVVWCQQHFPEYRIILAGFSFGSFVSLKHHERFFVQGIISVAPPVGRFELSTQKKPDMPWLVIMGTSDEVVSPQAVFDWMTALHAEENLVKVDDAGHFFHGRLLDLKDIVIGFLSNDINRVN